MNETANETEWAADRKVGFALGILLVGVVAALFFRTEPLDVTNVPSVDRADELDDRLRDRNVSVYSDGEAVGSNKPVAADTRWTRPELLDEFAGLPVDVPQAIGQTEPDPLPTNSPQILPAATFDSANDSAIVNPGTPLAAGDPSHAPAVTAPHAEEEPFQEYTIRYGDTLSGIADEYLGSSSRYRDIYEANKDRMASPDRLKVGTAIRIPRL